MKKIEVYGRDNCPWCEKAVELLIAHKLDYAYHDIEEDFQAKLDFTRRTRGTTVPQILVGEHLIGGCDDLSVSLKAGIIQQMVGGN